MPRKRRIELRKKPTTAAGAQITEAVLVAAGQVLEEHGADKLTTNLVAQKAGVSVGSLYQYFPNKDAIMAELARRLERMTEEHIVAALQQSEQGSLRETAERIVDIMLGQLGGLQMRRALRVHLPPDWTMETSSSVDTTVRERLAAQMTGHRDIRDGDHELMAWIVGHAIEHVVEQAVIAAPELLTTPAFRDELVELAVRYLRA